MSSAVVFQQRCGPTVRVRVAELASNEPREDAIETLTIMELICGYERGVEAMDLVLKCRQVMPRHVDGWLFRGVYDEVDGEQVWLHV